MLNETISEYFSLLSKLMDIHGDNSFKSKSYANAAFQIDRLPHALIELDKKEWAGLRGIGTNIAAKIDELINTGRLEILDAYLAKTPTGVVEMLRIKGLGPKKIHTVWKEMEIESIGELLYACNENRIMLYKGFGEKTQQNVRDAILFMMAQHGRFLYQQAEPFVELYQERLLEKFGNTLPVLTGCMRRHDEIVSQIDFLVQMNDDEILSKMHSLGFENPTLESGGYVYKIEQSPALVLHACTMENAGTRLMVTTGTEAFLKYIEEKMGCPLHETALASEADIFSKAGLPYMLPPHREIATNESYYLKYAGKAAADVNSIKGIIHSHSTWSDGTHTIETMAKTAIQRNLQYFVISDHSQAASYAGGLRPDEIIQQHAEIDALNQQLAPFKIFKGIECDILGNGQLDYDDEILQTFDLVIASVHSSLKMSQEKAMQRLLAAIENPYTMILGHMTGRLLLSRDGYPLDHKKIIDACAANQVVIELNAHPRRLDMDWRWIPYALEKDVLISINPDAHSTDGFDDIKYGTLVGEKALLPASNNLSSFSLGEFSEWLYYTRQMKGTI